LAGTCLGENLPSANSTFAKLAKLLDKHVRDRKALIKLG
jgi:hypothetical protein